MSKLILKGSLGNYHLVETEDQSQTLYSEAFGEACHSTHGARAETREIYLEGCHLLRAQNQEFTILEIGLGAGIGVVETLHYAKERKLRPLHFITTELDLDLTRYILGQPDLQELGPFHTSYEDNEIKVIEGANQSDFKLTVLVGDARLGLSNPEVLKRFTKAQAIYQDAFSPKRNPALWSIEWFKLLKEYWASSDCELSTYSASNSVRKALQLGGWNVSVAPGFGPKRQSTRANLASQAPHPDLAFTLERSGAVPLTDNELAHRLETLAAGLPKS